MRELHCTQVKDLGLPRFSGRYVAPTNADAYVSTNSKFVNIYTSSHEFTNFYDHNYELSATMMQQIFEIIIGKREKETFRCKMLNC